MKEINRIIGTMLKPVLKNYSPVILLIRRNWEQIVGAKYVDFCEVDRVGFQKNKRNDGVAYITTFNNVVSFYIQNNKIFILDKINSIFGYSLIVDIKLKQVPKVVKIQKKEIAVDKKNVMAIEQMTEGLGDNDLKTSLIKLGLSLYK